MTGQGHRTARGWSSAALMHPLAAAEPFAEFFDFIALGDGEELLVEIGQCLQRCKAERLDREATLLRLATSVEGVYVPQVRQRRRAEGALSLPPACVRGRLTRPCSCPPAPYHLVLRRARGVGRRRVPDARGRAAARAPPRVRARPLPADRAGALRGHGAQPADGGDPARLHARLPLLPARHADAAGEGRGALARRGCRGARHAADRL